MVASLHSVAKTGDVARAERLGHRRHQLRERGLFGLDLRPQVTPALEVSEVLGEIAVEAAQDCDAELGFFDLFGSEVSRHSRSERRAAWQRERANPQVGVEIERHGSRGPSDGTRRLSCSVIPTPSTRASGPPVLGTDGDPPTQEAEGDRGNSDEGDRRVGWLARLTVGGTGTEEEERQTNGDETER